MNKRFEYNEISESPKKFRVTLVKLSGPYNHHTTVG